jgi:hypothetical protein
MPAPESSTSHVTPLQATADQGPDISHVTFTTLTPGQIRAAKASADFLANQRFGSQSLVHQACPGIDG